MKEKKKRTPTLVEAIIVLLLVIVAIIGSNQLGAEMQLALFLGAFVALISCLYFRVPWENTQSTVLKSMADMMIPIIILMDVGIMVGAWIIGGTVPSLMYYGLKIVSPMLILPITFLCCMIMSVFTGTSFGSIATMGLAFTGVAIGAGVPVPMVVGAAVSGSWFGDKMSPMSDSVNLISAVTGISLYSHIGSMMFTSVPAAVVVFIIYTVMSISTSSGNASLDQIDTMMADLAANFDISIIALIPAVLMLVVSVMKIPAILGLSGVAIFSIFFAMFMQGESLGAVLDAAVNGYVSNTGIEMIDTILTRGGLLSMMATVALVLLAGLMGGALQASGILHVIMEKGIMRVVRSMRSLVLSGMIYTYIILFASGNQQLGAIMTAPMFREEYDKMGIHRKVLSRSIGDTATDGAPLVPWSVASAYIVGVLGCDLSYIPYAMLCYVIPIFTTIYALTGLFTWNSDGTPYLKRKKQKKIEAQ